MMTRHFRRDDPIPLSILITTALQRVLSLCAFLIFPILVGRAAGMLDGDLPAFLSTTLISLGIANLFQATRTLGSGYLCPAGMTSAYLSPSLVAARFGGLPLVFGMTFFAGAIEATLSRFLTSLKFLSPPEVTGIVILLVGTSNAFTSFKTLFPGSHVAPTDIVVALITLGVIIVANVLSGRAQIFCALFGIVAGYCASFAMGTVDTHALARLSTLPFVAVPTISLFHGWSFHLALVLPFAVVAFAATVKQAGFITSAAQLEGDTSEALPTAIRRGIMGDEMGTLVASVLGGLGLNVSAASAGLIAATSVSSRRVGYYIGIICIILGFQPHFAAILAVIPRGVVAAVLIFTSIFVVANGVQLIVVANLDREKTICVGLAVLSGLAIDAVPAIPISVPTAFLPLVSSSLVVGTVIAIVLNSLFMLNHFATRLVLRYARWFAAAVVR
jgi:NCS2 family nucleobase:cation symporter-2